MRTPPSEINPILITVIILLGMSLIYAFIKFGPFMGQQAKVEIAMTQNSDGVKAEKGYDGFSALPRTVTRRYCF